MFATDPTFPLKATQNSVPFQELVFLPVIFIRMTCLDKWRPCHYNYARFRQTHINSSLKPGINRSRNSQFIFYPRGRYTKCLWFKRFKWRSSGSPSVMMQWWELHYLLAGNIRQWFGMLKVTVNAIFTFGNDFIAQAWNIVLWFMAIWGIHFNTLICSNAFCPTSSTGRPHTHAHMCCTLRRNISIVTALSIRQLSLDCPSVVSNLNKCPHLFVTTRPWFSESVDCI